MTLSKKDPLFHLFFSPLHSLFHFGKKKIYMSLITFLPLFLFEAIYPSFHTDFITSRDYYMTHDDNLI
jgi:hypothetical protein